MFVKTSRKKPVRKLTLSHKKRRIQGRLVVPNATYKEDYRSFFLKKTTWDAIRYSRGWPERGAITRFATELHVCRQYAWDIVTQRTGCSTNVMNKIINILGLPHDACWCHLFDRVSMRNVDRNHPIFNQMKYQGEMPYSHLSPSANARRRDYNVESLNHHQDFQHM